MDHLAIDYFADIPASDKGPQLVGVSIRIAEIQNGGNTQDATGNSKVYLRLDTSNASPTVSYSKDLLYSTYDIWSISTDAYGKTVIVAKDYTEKATSLYYLATNDASTAIIARKLPDKTNVAAYTKALAHAQWTVNTVAEPTTASSDSKQPLSALCSITQGTKQLALDLDESKLTPKWLVLEDKDNSQGTVANRWMLEMQPMGPGQLDYQRNPWRLTTNETVGVILPFLSILIKLTME